MQPSNPLFMVNVSKLRSRLSSMLAEFKIKNLYFSDHFLDRAVERNIDHRVQDLFMMALVAMADMKKTTFNTTTYKVSGKGAYLLAKITNGVVSNQRRLVVLTCYDADVFDESRFEVHLTF